MTAIVLANTHDWRSTMNHRPAQRLGLVALGAAIALCLCLAGTAHAKPKILGKWKAVAMKAKGTKRPVPPAISIRFNFMKNGKMVGTIKVTAPNGKSKTKTEKGTWKIKGNKITVTNLERKKTDVMTYKVKAKKLTLIKKPDQDELYLERL